MTQTVLILGGKGRFGRHATQAFENAGWQVRQFNRAKDNLATAMQGADVVVMGWNPPGYHLWARQLVALHKEVAKAARAAGATVILPGNVYVYGPEASSPWTAETPHLARNPLGRLRIAAEDAYRAAGTRTIILRCGDFIDGENSGNWFESHIARKAHNGQIRYPGDPTVPHAWAYLPDAARAAVALSQQRDRLNRFEDVPFPGYTLSGDDLAAAISRAIGIKITVRSFNWGLMRLLRPFVPVLGGLFEMRYLWSLPQELDGGRLAALLPDFEPTPIEAALSAALAHQSRPGDAFS
ncbi:NAD-dependent epimerase/dehydratase family protein [Sinisalibacter lacisalsi]|uniref:Oxidoreductase n=1 Tax=Sinisalibacter lacisalsi TaxID=1526570 RepID=A0ABQ1QD00_9RHOB|nr:NAD-dependent epimerase/dehydratase family protein [Sinisalibacter lacisalsi]GGD22198.1 oxidoreductase [Sinisalibacter lacisalsi]